MQKKKSRTLPKIIADIGFDFSWDNKKVWQLAVPVETMTIEALAWHFDMPFWNTPGGFYDLTPNDVLTSPETYNAEFIRVMKADLTYPLDIMFWKNRWLLLDGLHRLAKAKQLGYKTVQVRKIPQEAIRKIKTEE